MQLIGSVVFEMWNKHCVTVRGSCSMEDCITVIVLDDFVVDSMQAKLYSCS